MKEFLNEAVLQNNPLRIIREFLETEHAYAETKQYNKMRFVGYVLEMGFNSVTIITSDPYKINVGGIPRNSLLIMIPDNYKEFPYHFMVLRVVEAAPTPLSREVQQTYFELQKRSMPELDVFTQSELQWGALKTMVLGMFYPDPESVDDVEFSGDMTNFVSAHKYRIYSPTDEILNLIVNSMVPQQNRFNIGQLRLTECRLPLPTCPLPNVPVYVSTDDFIGCRTAMFGKTRLGKSNVVKILAQSIIETTRSNHNVGQLIFDINGEYANDNQQNISLRTAYPDLCFVYALTPKQNTPSRPLRLNFYEQPCRSKEILGSRLTEDNRASGYVSSFISVQLMPIEDIQAIQDRGDQCRAFRKIQIYWAILNRAGYHANEGPIRAHRGGVAHGFNPAFNDALRQAAYSPNSPPTAPNSLAELQAEIEVINTFRIQNPNDPLLQSGRGNPLFGPDEIALLEFFAPQARGLGTRLIQAYRHYHDQNAGNFILEIINHLEQGHTVVLDLGNANEQIVKYFSNLLSRDVFNHQVMRFSNDQMGDFYIQVYFEEAHNLFPLKVDDVTDIYSRFAKEGAKYHIGMIYSTQSPTTINKDLLAQTENFFIAHLSSQDEVRGLGKLNYNYDSLQEDILQTKRVGYIRMLTRSHRFVIPVQVNLFNPQRPHPQATPVPATHPAAAAAQQIPIRQAVPQTQGG